MGLVSRRGSVDDRIWTFELANLGDEELKGAQLNYLAFVQAIGEGSCQPSILTGFPIVAGDLAPRTFKTFEVEVDFSKCSGDARFNTSAFYSSDQGAIAAGVVDAAMEP